jgi:hypothetical protein
MAWSDIALAGVQTVGSYILQSRDAKSKKKWQKYQNAMVRLQGAQNQNVLTDNENMARERSAEEAQLIRRSEYITKASVEVEAAATGTTGRSVNLALFDVGRNAAIADANRQRELDLTYLGIDNQRRQLALEVALSQDTTQIVGPNPFASLLDFAGSVGKTGGIPAIPKRTTRPASPTRPNDPWVQNGVNYRL